MAEIRNIYLNVLNVSGNNLFSIGDVYPSLVYK
jgi:hypothetical protein